jgi:hypothetical protein
VRQRERRHVPDDDESDLPVPGGVGPDDGVVDLAAGGAEQVGALAERVRGQEGDALALEQQQREVVGRDVRERDRHERVHEASRQPHGAEAAADAVRPQRAEPVEAIDEQDRDGQPDQEGQLERVLRREADVLKEARDVGRDAGPDRGLGGPVEGDRADHHGEQRHRPGPRPERGQPRQRPPQPDHAVARLDGRDPREQVEVDGERLATGDPRLDSVQGHGDEGHRRVHERGDGEVLGTVAVRRHELHHSEQEDARGRRPVSEPLRVAEGRRQVAAGPHSGDPAHRPPDGAPRVERLEDVAEQDAGGKQP